MKINKALVRGSLVAAVGLPLALMLPSAASARWFPTPSVTAVSPDSGPASGGTTVTITGIDLTYISGVDFGNVPASYTIVSNSEIIATAPAESRGTVVVQVKAGSLFEPSSADFTYS
jgi:IPT/TIG domain